MLNIKKIETKEEKIYNLISEVDRDVTYEVISKMLKKCEECAKPEKLSPLTIEIAMGNKKEVVNLIKQGININSINEFGMTPLMIAIYFNDLEIVNLLIQKGANVNLKSVNGLTPLMFACSIGNDKIVQLLLSNGSDINAIDKEENNALLHAVNTENRSLWGTNLYILKDIFYNHYNENMKKVTISEINCIKLLAEAGIDINYSNKGVNALSIVLEKFGNLYTKKLEMLIEFGAEKKAIEVSPDSIYNYQYSFDFMADIRAKDISCWADAPYEYLCFLEYMARIKKYGIEVYSRNLDDGIKRPKIIKPLIKA